MTRPETGPVLDRLPGLTVGVLIAILTSNSAAPAEPLDWPAVVVSVTNGTTNIVIPGTGTGTSTGAPANVYPSSITLGGITGTVVGVP